MSLPQTKLSDQNGNLRMLADFGKQVLLYVYPKDGTPGCTIENRDFSNHRDDFLSLGIEPVGLSADTIESHSKFCDAHGLRNTLLSDPHMELIKALGAYGEKNMYGKLFSGITRSTFLIDTEKNEVIRSWSKVRAVGHVAKILTELRSA